MKGTLYLIPSLLGDTEVGKVIPAFNNELVLSIKYYVAEDVRTVRRFLKKANKTINIDELNFSLLNEHTDEKEIPQMLEPLLQGFDVGVVSEAGCPAIADPGAKLVDLAHRKGIKIVPLVGPSSIVLSLMASGFNGQSFAFEGYLPIDANQRVKKLKQFEKRIFSENQTQIFIETPYRNDKTLRDLIANCSSQLRLCIAANITTSNEWICTKNLYEWKKQLPEIGKVPCIFLLYK
ncbi:MAG: SAM-dependent methyltransferase [Paludibacteraceae bacterium]|jgi:16S rRNA (cytidine1402-2'-O)-methyltransferase|nr:SAM-dependent methyltransferase [Paludibacteraceae bacterium]MBO7724398.1 SAM-dependent methyltransferase [Paludibacteraceae bacterium]